MNGERVAVRGTLRGKLMFCNYHTLVDASGDVDAMAKEHVEAIDRGEIDMIEIEFIDDPSPERFFRIGTNPNGMVMPQRLDLRGGKQ